MRPQLVLKWDRWAGAAADIWCFFFLLKYVIGGKNPKYPFQIEIRLK